MKNLALPFKLIGLWFLGMTCVGFPSYAEPVDNWKTSIDEVWALYQQNECAVLGEKIEELEGLLEEEEAWNTPEFDKLCILLARHTFYQGKYEEAFELIKNGSKKGTGSSELFLDWAWMSIESGLLEKSEVAIDRLEELWKEGDLPQASKMDFLFAKAEKERIIGKDQGLLFKPLEEHLPFLQNEDLKLSPKEKTIKALLFQIWGAGLVSTAEQFDSLNSVRRDVEQNFVPAYLEAFYWSKMASTGIGNQPNDSVRKFIAYSNAAFEPCYATDHIARAYPVTKEAFFYWNTGEYARMLELLELWESNILDQGFEDHYVLPFIWRNQAGGNSRVGNNEKAVTQAKKAVLKMERLHPGGHRELDVFYNTLANSYGSADLDNPDFQIQALRTYEKALELRKHYYPPEDRGIVVYQQNIGMTYFFLGQTEKAFAIYDDALKTAIASLGPDNLYVARIYLNLGELYLNSGELDKAISNTRRGSEIFQQMTRPSDPMRVMSHVAMAYAFMFQGTEDSILNQISLAFQGYFPEFDLNEIEAFARPENFRMYDLQVISSLFAVLGDYYVDTDQLEKARATFKTSLTWIGQFALRSSYGAAGWGRASVYTEHYAKLLLANYELFSRTGNDAYTQESFAYADAAKTNTLRFHLQGNKAVAYANIPQKELDKGDELYRAYNDMENQLLEQRQLTLNPTELVDIQVETELRRQAYLDWQKKLELKYPDYYKLKYDQHLIYPKEVHQKLKDPKSLLVEYHWVEGRYLLKIAFDQDRIVQELDTLNDDFRLRIQDFMYGLTEKNFAENESYSEDFYRNFLQNSHQLYEQLLGGILDSFSNKSYDKLLIIPDGLLSKFPFGVLIEELPEGQKMDYGDLAYLMKKYRIRLEYSASLIPEQQNKRKAAAYPYLGFAPEFNGLYRQQLSKAQDSTQAISRLFFNQEEVVQAYEMLGGRMFRGKEAFEGSVKKYLERASVLHFATHTLLNDTFPMYTSLVLQEGGISGEDGLLHAYEIYPRELKAQLAVLSACETGIGKWRNGEGMMSLARPLNTRVVPIS